jgi:hypothetical protein
VLCADPTSMDATPRHGTCPKAQVGYYPVRTGLTQAPPRPTLDARPLDTDRLFRPLPDSDRLLRRWPFRSRSPPRSPEPPSRRRRPDLNSTPTPSVINSFLSPFRCNASGPTRSRSPSRGSRSSSSAWSRSDPRGSRRPRSDSLPRPTLPSKRAWRPPTVQPSSGGGEPQAEATPRTAGDAASPAASIPTTSADSPRDSVRESLAAVVREKEVQWTGVHNNLTGSLLQRFGLLGRCHHIPLRIFPATSWNYPPSRRGPGPLPPTWTPTSPASAATPRLTSRRCSTTDAKTLRSRRCGTGPPLRPCPS